MTTPWDYATIAFQPYPDVGEFVNIGVLATAVSSRVLAYRLLPAQNTARINGFFPELDLAIYKEGRKRIEAELQRLESAVNTTIGRGVEHAILPGSGQPTLPLDEKGTSHLFKALTAPRDGLFRFHAKGTRLAGSAEAILDGLFERFVIRVSAQAEDPDEIRLVREVSSLLEEWKLRRFYRKDVRVGTAAFHVKFPFGYQPDEEQPPQRVIKPINLAQVNSTQIYHRGDMWVANMRRLRNLQTMPERVLLSLRMPLVSRGARRDDVVAAEEIRGQLAEFGVAIAESGDRKALRSFAEIDDSENLVLLSK